MKRIATTRPHRRGWTLIEMCVLMLLTAVVVAVAAPSIATIGCSSHRLVSRSNLAQLMQAHVAYAGDFDGRQHTMVPDDLGAFGGCAGYLAAGNCIEGVSLGTSCKGDAVGFPIGCGGSGSCANFELVNPLNFAPAIDLGAYRILNASGFQPYVDGRFYSPVFYAPDDAGVIEEASQYFNDRCEYAAPPRAMPVWSSYIRSPAAMFNPQVFSKQTGFKNPNTLATGYQSPAFTAAIHPTLKTLLIEHNTIENTFTPCNEAIEGCPPFRFNQVFESRPLALMFDGSVRILSPREAMESDGRARATSPGGVIEKGLWHRGTPFGQNGVGGAQGADFMVDTSYHYLTGDGILGRDTLD